MVWIGCVNNFYCMKIRKFFYFDIKINSDESILFSSLFVSCQHLLSVCMFLCESNANHAMRMTFIRPDILGEK